MRNRLLAFGRVWAEYVEIPEAVSNVYFHEIAGLFVIDFDNKY